MKTVQLRVGKRGGPYVRVPIQEPENPGEFLALHNGNENYLTKTANRGRRIDIQEEARDTVAEMSKEGKTQEEIVDAVTKLLNEVDLTVKKPRKVGERKPKEIKLPSKMPTNLEDLKKLLEAQGLKVTA